MLKSPKQRAKWSKMMSKLLYLDVVERGDQQRVDRRDVAVPRVHVGSGVAAVGDEIGVDGLKPSQSTEFGHRIARTNQHTAGMDTIYRTSKTHGGCGAAWGGEARGNWSPVEPKSRIPSAPSL